MIYKPPRLPASSPSGRASCCPCPDGCPVQGGGAACGDGGGLAAAARCGAPLHRQALLQIRLAQQEEAEEALQVQEGGAGAGASNGGRVRSRVLRGTEGCVDDDRSHHRVDQPPRTPPRDPCQGREPARRSRVSAGASCCAERGAEQPGWRSLWRSLCDHLGRCRRRRRRRRRRLQASSLLGAERRMR